jgi:hypothetical protein
MSNWNVYISTFQMFVYNTLIFSLKWEIDGLGYGSVGEGLREALGSIPSTTPTKRRKWSERNREGTPSKFLYT